LCQRYGWSQNKKNKHKKVFFHNKP